MSPFGFVVLFALSYLLGSAPFGIIVSRFAGAPNPRTIGSHNIGATNVLRTGRKDLAALTLLLDALKGTLAVRIGIEFGDIDGGVVAAFGAFLGHLFPVWIGFKGGKGVATFLGCLIGLDLTVAAIFAVVWLLVAFATRFSSLAALSAATLTPVALIVMRQTEAALLYILMAALLFWRHRGNIERLRSGEESRIGEAS